MFGKNFSKKPTTKQVIGSLGEDIACNYLIKSNYKILDRNYYKMCGELDIVAVFNNIIHFIEVKTVSRETSYFIKNEVTRGTNGEYRPEDNIHPWKLKRLSRIIQSYLIDKKVSDDVDWQFDLINIYLNNETKDYNIDHIEDIVL